MILRFLGWQGIAGLVLAAALSLLLLVQKSETRRWKKQSDQFEQLYRGEQGAHRQTELDFRRAADAARAADRANADRVRREQAAINQEMANDLQIRLAGARARADRLRRPPPAASTDPRGRGSAPVPGVSAAPGGAGQAARADRLSDSDALIATEQAIQLDELIKWVWRQAGVDANAGPAAEPSTKQAIPRR